METVLWIILSVGAIIIGCRIVIEYAFHLARDDDPDQPEAVMSRLLDAEQLAEAWDAVFPAIDAFMHVSEDPRTACDLLRSHIAALNEELAAERAESDRFRAVLAGALATNRAAVWR